jgi:hypothetical protein
LFSKLRKQQYEKYRNNNTTGDTVVRTESKEEVEVKVEVEQYISRQRAAIQVDTSK